MKTLTLSALLCAMMALTRAAALLDAGNKTRTEETSVQEAGNWTKSFNPAGVRHVVKRSTLCPCGWTAINGRCFLYVPRTMSWAVAERNCQSLDGNLASVQNIQEYQEIQAMIVRATQNQRETWIGGSDAQQEGFWFWSDGTPFYFTYWCPGEPNNVGGHQNCLLMNSRDQRCWDDGGCEIQFPSVCVRNA